jgi:hypothetical protein
MKKGLLGSLCFLVNCFWSTGQAIGLDDDVAFASEAYAAVASGDLGEERARESVGDFTLARSALKATMAGNTAITNNMTAYNIIDNGAFTDAGGIVTVIQNTGNNVIIQNLTDVNVTITP